MLQDSLFELTDGFFCRLLFEGDLKISEMTWESIARAFFNTFISS